MGRVRRARQRRRADVRRDGPHARRARRREFAATLRASIPMGRWADAGDVVGPVLFLASPASALRHRPDPLRRRRSDGADLNFFEGAFWGRRRARLGERPSGSTTRVGLVLDSRLVCCNDVLHHGWVVPNAGFPRGGCRRRIHKGVRGRGRTADDGVGERRGTAPRGRAGHRPSVRDPAPARGRAAWALLAELAARVGLPRSTTHRIVRALSQEDFVLVAPSGKLRVGPSLIHIAVASRRDFRHEAAPYLERLSHELHETVDLGGA